LTARTIRAAESEEGEVNWASTRTLVTGGASFIGSHLVEALVDRGASVRVVDNLSSGRAEYLRNLDVEFLGGDLLDQGLARRAVRGIDVVFHLAADHGGRGYVDLHQAACATNLALDGNLFLASLDAGVEKVVFASSGCVYPNFRSEDPDEVLYLAETMAGPPYDADNMYGLPSSWAR
jgi:nucleoside-diphosphate-sugar epimerase